MKDKNVRAEGYWERQLDHGSELTEPEDEEEIDIKLEESDEYDVEEGSGNSKKRKGRKRRKKNVKVPTSGSVRKMDAPTDEHGK